MASTYLSIGLHGIGAFRSNTTMSTSYATSTSLTSFASGAISNSVGYLADAGTIFQSSYQHQVDPREFPVVESAVFTLSVKPTTSRLCGWHEQVSTHARRADDIIRSSLGC